MLPLFQIITPNSPSKNMPTNDIPTKPRRKKVDVPVHKTHDVFQEGRKKSFSANFNSKKYKFKNPDTEGNFNEPIHTEIVVELPDTDREKISLLQNSNEEIDKENKYLKEQYHNLVLGYEDLQKQLETSKFCKNCEDLKISIEQYSTDNSILRNSNKELKEDLNMLKTVVYSIKITKSGLIQDIIESQDLTENISRNILSEVHQNHKHTPVSWGSVSVHTLGPLLDAYEDTIKEKEEIIQNYDVELSNFTVGQMKRDYNVMHEEYIKCRTENAALKEKSKALVNVQDDFRSQMQNYIPVSVHTASVNECKKWYEELKLQYENEKQKLKENIDTQAKTIGQLNSEITGLRNVKVALETKITQLEKHIKKMETKCLELEHALNEVQVSRSALRKQLHKVMGFAKDMVAEQEMLLKALNERHMENKVVKRIGSDMATRMDSLKNQLKDVQKSAWQEFTTVEHKIHEQTELIETMKEEHEKEIEDLKKNHQGARRN
ncbi:hypothetical protein NQ314_012238 [Rhamnusium bicolor]|uniref:Uncharacterized protein n=1 Tax=Rhamnusium bicolor TaxID=1586634 RepID=A0AAV8XDJ7_9CUCU|nr:hypothetical protein NQ314_012238 [Rhamnusium bicolor]